MTGLASFAISVLMVLIAICVLAGLYYVVVWVLGKLGIEIPPRALMIISIIFGLMCLIWLIHTLFISPTPFRLWQG